jgi:glycosyltransferase involved in cell wall biosynthesis
MTALYKPLMATIAHRPRGPLSPLNDIVESIEDGIVVLSPASQRPVRRVLYVNSYGGSDVLAKVKAGLLPAHHLWGCIELVRMGYAVALAEPLSHFYLYRHPLPHDLKLFRVATNWLGKDGIIYCGHTLLYWLPLLKLVGTIRNPIVSLIYAREHLDFARAHTGIIALTPAAAAHAKIIAPQAKVAHLGWGVDVSFFPKLSYQPDWFLACGITHRDFPTLAAAAARSSRPIRLICPGIPPAIAWSDNVTIIDGGAGWNFQKSNVSYKELLFEHYAGSAGSLIVLKNDPTEKTAVGFTNLIEALAMARPVIVTNTGALPGEIDVERVGCGLQVPAADPFALADAIEALSADPQFARTMGEQGRTLVESQYNIVRYATQLHSFFDSL